VVKKKSFIALPPESVDDGDIHGAEEVDGLAWFKFSSH
jgi:hypothetical protein